MNTEIEYLKKQLRKMQQRYAEIRCMDGYGEAILHQFNELEKQIPLLEKKIETMLVEQQVH